MIRFLFVSKGVVKYAFLFVVIFFGKKNKKERRLKEGNLIFFLRVSAVKILNIFISLSPL